MLLLPLLLVLLLLLLLPLAALPCAVGPAMRQGPRLQLLPPRWHKGEAARTAAVAALSPAQSASAPAAAQAPLVGWLAQVLLLVLVLLLLTRLALLLLLLLLLVVRLLLALLLLLLPLAQTAPPPWLGCASARRRLRHLAALPAALPLPGLPATPQLKTHGGRLTAAPPLCLAAA